MEFFKLLWQLCMIPFTDAFFSADFVQGGILIFVVAIPFVMLLALLREL